MLNVLRCVFIIIGTIIGAGFASGQEIAVFFNRFGVLGLYGIILACALFGVIIFWILYVTAQKNIRTLDELVGNHKILRFINSAFLLISFCIMIAGIGAFFEQQFEISSFVGAFVGATICFLVFSYRYKGLEIFNTVLVPFIILGILLVSFGKYDLSALDKVKYTLQSSFTNHFLLASILYVGYNSLMLMPILFTLKSYDLSRRGKVAVAIFSFLILCTVGVALFRAIGLFFPKILAFQLPTLKLASLLGPTAKFLYGFIILFAIFTTAISCGYSFLEMNEKNFMRKNLGLCVIAFLLSGIGFSGLVNTMFPIFGYFGVFELLVAVFRGKAPRGELREKERRYE